jgi:hypothetical protein
VQRFPFTPEEAFASLVDGYLDPDELWFFDVIDRRERTIFCTANRHYLAIDEPDRPIEPALEVILQRLEADDPDLVIVPRMPNDERARHMEEFAREIAEPDARATFVKRQRAMRDRWDDFWRPGSFRALASDLPADVERAWVARIHASAARAIARFLEEKRLTLAGFDRLVFD